MRLLGMRVTSNVGIGFEPLCSGAQQFRHCCEIPIIFLWLDVTKVDREVGQ